MQIKKWSSKDKLTIVLEGLKGTVPLRELSANLRQVALNDFLDSSICNLLRSRAIGLLFRRLRVRAPSASFAALSVTIADKAFSFVTNIAFGDDLQTSPFSAESSFLWFLSVPIADSG
jgi:hypothetical protein